MNKALLLLLILISLLYGQTTVGLTVNVMPKLELVPVSPLDPKCKVNSSLPLSVRIQYVGSLTSQWLGYPSVTVTINGQNANTDAFGIGSAIFTAGSTPGTYSVDASINTDTYPEFTGRSTVKFNITVEDNDTDGDGILDLNDACPNIAEDMDGYEDGDGCPDYDNDSDGILDVADKCPNNPEDMDGFQDEDGCPEEVNMTLAVEDLFGPISEDIEETEGAFIHFNTDDDNKNGIMDYQDGNVLLENDIVRIDIEFEDLNEGIVTLKKDNFNSNLWKSSSKGIGNEILVGSDEINYDLSLPEQKQEFEYIKENLFVEGLVNNTASMITMEYKTIDEEIIASDIIKFSFIAATCGRQPTVDERNLFLSDFSELKNCEWSVTGELDPNYNCIAWTVGLVDTWINNLSSDPSSNVIGIDEEYGNNDGVLQLNEVDNFYNAFGYLPTTESSAVIQYYSNFHGAKHKTECKCGMNKWVMFESKCGAYLKIEHIKDQLSKGSYGVPVQYYKKK